MPDQDKTLFPEMSDITHSKALGRANYDLAAKLSWRLRREKEFDKEPELSPQKDNGGANPPQAEKTPAVPL